MKKEILTLDYSKFLKLCGYAKSKEIGIGGFNEGVIPYLGRSFLETKIHLEAILEGAIKEVKSRPLQSYREPSQLKAAWELSEISLPLLEASYFLRTAEPEKSGIFYFDANKNLAVLSTESLDSLGLFKEDKKWYKWGEAVWELYFSLHWWQEAVRCVWAGIIMHRLAPILQNKKLLPGDSKISSEKNIFFQAEMSDLDRPIGLFLSFPYLSDEKAEELYQLYNKAHFGSRFCETETGYNFKEWLRKLDIGSSQKHDLTFEQADAVLMAGSQRNPELDIDLIWDQKEKLYQFGCRIKNKDVHGFDDSSKTTHIPEGILFDFFRQTDQKTQENILRLLIRGGWQKARDLVFPAIMRSLD